MRKIRLSWHTIKDVTSVLKKLSAFPWHTHAFGAAIWMRVVTGSRGLYLNLCGAWDIQELNKYCVMIASHGLADELNFETWKNSISSRFLSLPISKMGRWQEASPTQRPMRPGRRCKWVKGCLQGKSRLGSREDCGKLEVHAHPAACLNSAPVTFHVGRWAHCCQTSSF